MGVGRNVSALFFLYNIKVMKSVIIQNKDIAQALANPKTSSKKLLEPVKSITKEVGIYFNVLEDDTSWSDVEIHHHEADMWHCLEGEATFLLGGTLINPQLRKNELMPFSAV